MPKKTHGGRRKGAGRPVVAEKDRQSKVFGIRLTAADHELVVSAMSPDEWKKRILQIARRAKR